MSLGFYDAWDVGDGTVTEDAVVPMANFEEAWDKAESEETVAASSSKRKQDEAMPSNPAASSSKAAPSDDPTLLRTKRKNKRRPLKFHSCTHLVTVTPKQVPTKEKKKKLINYKSYEAARKSVKEEIPEETTPGKPWGWVEYTAELDKLYKKEEEEMAKQQITKDPTAKPAAPTAKPMADPGPMPAAAHIPDEQLHDELVKLLANAASTQENQHQPEASVLPPWRAQRDAQPVLQSTSKYIAKHSAAKSQPAEPQTPSKAVARPQTPPKAMSPPQSPPKAAEVKMPPTAPAKSIAPMPAAHPLSPPGPPMWPKTTGLDPVPKPPPPPPAPKQNVLPKGKAGPEYEGRFYVP